MEPRDRFHPAPAGDVPPVLAQVQRDIDRLERVDRASLRPWILAHYDVRGYPATGYAAPDGTARSASTDRAADRP